MGKIGRLWAKQGKIWTEIGLKSILMYWTGFVLISNFVPNLSLIFT